MGLADFLSDLFGSGKGTDWDDTSAKEHNDGDSGHPDSKDSSNRGTSSSSKDDGWGSWW